MTVTVTGLGAGFRHRTLSISGNGRISLKIMSDPNRKPSCANVPKCTAELAEEIVSETLQ
jgi:hypothetical protein